MGERSKPRGSFGRGKGVSTLSPSPGSRSACFALAFLPTAEPGPRLVQYRSHAQDDRHDPIWRGYKQEKIYLWYSCGINIFDKYIEIPFQDDVGLKSGKCTIVRRPQDKEDLIYKL